MANFRARLPEHVRSLEKVAQRSPLKIIFEEHQDEISALEIALKSGRISTSSKIWFVFFFSNSNECEEDDLSIFS
jgi:hypothetical protein